MRGPSKLSGTIILSHNLLFLFIELLVVRCYNARLTSLTHE